jgi:hypothetical protein
LNYKICKEKGYEKEAAQLKAEADKRGIVFESMSLIKFIENYYDVNDYYNTFVSRTYNI